MQLNSCRHSALPYLGYHPQPAVSPSVTPAYPTPGDIEWLLKAPSQWLTKGTTGPGLTLFSVFTMPLGPHSLSIAEPPVLCASWSKGVLCREKGKPMQSTAPATLDSG